MARLLPSEAAAEGARQLRRAMCAVHRAEEARSALVLDPPKARIVPRLKVRPQAMRTMRMSGHPARHAREPLARFPRRRRTRRRRHPKRGQPRARPATHRLGNPVPSRACGSAGRARTPRARRVEVRAFRTFQENLRSSAPSISLRPAVRARSMCATVRFSPMRAWR